MRKKRSMKKIPFTKMMTSYMCKLVLRVIIFIAVFAFYIINKEGLYQLVTEPFWNSVSFIHVLWFIFMAMMIRHIVFPKNATMALRKADETEYEEKTKYDKLELYEYVYDQNIKAWRVMLVWLCVNAIWGILYLFQVFDNADLVMLSVFYFLCDYICILFFCPFQTGIMKNKCCVNSRIYDWGHFMMFTPMLFIKNFFSWSLFFTSCIVLLHWEIIYAKYPERFWSGSNRKLESANCKDKICKYKRKINSLMGK